MGQGEPDNHNLLCADTADVAASLIHAFIKQKSNNNKLYLYSTFKNHQSA